MIDGNVVKDLCRLGVLGSSESSEAQALLKRLQPRGEMSRRSWEEWDKTTDALDTASLASLVRGLLLTEEALLQWSSGSVSPVIWTFRALEQRSLEEARAVAAWGREKTTNFYVPFNEQRRRYREDNRQRAAGSADRQKQQEADAEQAEQGRRERARLAERHRTVSSSNASERADLLQRLNDLPLPERLQALVNNRDRPLTWFPESWASEAIGSVDELAPELRDDLVERLAGHRRGPWRQLREALKRMASL
jgi:hypothetical protein